MEMAETGTINLEIRAVATRARSSAGPATGQQEHRAHEGSATRCTQGRDGLPGTWKKNVLFTGEMSTRAATNCAGNLQGLQGAKLGRF